MHPQIIQRGTLDNPYATRLSGEYDRLPKRSPYGLNDRFIRVNQGSDDLEDVFSKLTLSEDQPSTFIPATNTQLQLKKYTAITERTAAQERNDHLLERISCTVKRTQGVVAYTLNNFSPQFYAHNVSGIDDGFYITLGHKIYHLTATRGKATCIYDAKLGIYTLRTLHAFDKTNPKIIFGRQNFRDTCLLDVSTGTNSVALPWKWNCGLLYAAESLDSSSVFLGRSNGDVELYDCRNKRGDLFYEDRYNMPVCSLQLSPDQKKLAAGRDDGSVLLWDLRKLTKPLSTHNADVDTPFRALAWKPDSSGHLYSGDGKTTRCLRLFDTNELNSPPVASWQLGSCIADITFISQNMLLTSQKDPIEVLYGKGYDMTRAATLLPAKGCSAISRTLGTYFSSETGVIAAVSSNQTVTTYDVKQLQRMEEPKPSNDRPRHVHSFSIR